ncbi:hypothetical protein CDL12_05516 [Handroanthus impetiginosus]|uniref:Uncharacterized protein n=1 Tax=Handroanthus impetiginosus TaxID=429701 RepID=A0A2G9HW82_9LAMI|nr:hypothetical protein CDL12_05516 [Handroanthus impetiginosus]
MDNDLTMELYIGRIFVREFDKVFYKRVKKLLHDEASVNEMRVNLKEAKVVTFYVEETTNPTQVIDTQMNILFEEHVNDENVNEEHVDDILNGDLNETVNEDNDREIDEIMASFDFSFVIGKESCIDLGADGMGVNENDINDDLDCELDARDKDKKICENSDSLDGFCSEDFSDSDLCPT